MMKFPPENESSHIERSFTQSDVEWKFNDHCGNSGNVDHLIPTRTDQEHLYSIFGQMPTYMA
jgi:hypothetical protein